MRRAAGAARCSVRYADAAASEPRGADAAAPAGADIIPGLRWRNPFGFWFASVSPLPGPLRGTRRPFGLWLGRPFLRRPKGGGAGGGTRTPTGLAALRIFIPATAFAAALRRLGSGLSLHLAPSPGVRCCPSSLYTFPRAGLARDYHFTGFPEFEQFYVADFPARTQVVQVRCVYQFRHARTPSPA